MKDLKSLLNKRKDISARGGSAFGGKKIIFDTKDVFYVFTRIIKKEFGQIGAEKFQPDYFGKKVLVIKCASPTWASELWLNKGKIIRLMNEELGEGTVIRIRTKN